jgi:hypothetical protein
MNSLIELQQQQKRHDEQFHRDIFFLSHQERFKHVTFHLGKYVARLARMIKQSETGKPIDEFELRKTLVDAIIMMLNAAEIFNLDLSKLLTPESSRRDSITIAELSQLLRTQYSGKYKWLESGDRKAFVYGLMLDLSDQAGVFHKACDSLDHMEGLSRENVTATLLSLFVVLLLAGEAVGTDYASSIPSRWREIEKSKVL